MTKEQQVRSIAYAVIRRVVAEHDGPADSLFSAVETAYPFGERKGPVYQLWRDEADRILGAGSARDAA